jgi:hypothetical protein
VNALMKRQKRQAGTVKHLKGHCLSSFLYPNR